MKKKYDELSLQYDVMISKLRSNGLLEEIQSSVATEYATDEELLAEETEWITRKAKEKRNAKKRKAEFSPEAPPPVPASSRIRFEATKKHTPPPIFVQHADLQTLKAALDKENFKGRITCLQLKTSFKVSCANEEEYRKISQSLNDAKYPWHSFSDKQSRPLRVMARGLHPDTSIESIVNHLRSKDFNIENAVNILNNKTKQPLPLFMLTFDHTEDSKKVFDIKVIEYQSVKIEEVRKISNRIVQCKNCQGYNHVKTYCHKPPRCVKCAGDHISADCPKPRESKPICVNCGESHTANYRGCITAKELQRLRNQSVHKKMKVDKPEKPNFDPKSRQMATQNQLAKNLSTVPQNRNNRGSQSSYAQITAQGSAGDKTGSNPKGVAMKASASEPLEKLRQRIEKLEGRHKNLLQSVENKIEENKNCVMTAIENIVKRLDEQATFIETQLATINKRFDRCNQLFQTGRK